MMEDDHLLTKGLGFTICKFFEQELTWFLKRHCQTVLQASPQCYGWLRKKTNLIKTVDYIGKNIPSLTNVATKFSNMVPWEKQFFILRNRYIYVFKDETSKSNEKIIRLCDFAKVELVNLDNKDVPWPFKLVTRDTGQEELFAATSQDEQTKWLSTLKEQLPKAGGFSNGRAGHSSRSRLPVPPAPNDDQDDYEDPEETETIRQPRSTNRGPLPPTPESPQNKTLNKNSSRDSGGIYDQPDEDDNETPPNSNSSNHLRRGSSTGSSGGNFSKIGSKLPAKPLVLPPPGKLDLSSPSVLTQQRRLPHPGPLKPPATPSWKQAAATQLKKPPPAPPGEKPPVKIPAPKLAPLNEMKSEIYEDVTYEVEEEREESPLVKKAMWNGDQNGATKTMTSLSAQEGAFLIRKASEGTGYTMHVICSGSSRKFKISVQNKKYVMADKNFDKLDDLIKHFRNANLPNNTTCLGKTYQELTGRR